MSVAVPRHTVLTCRFEEHRLASENIGFKAGGGAAVGRLPPDQHHKLELQGVLPTDDSFKYHWNISQRHYNAVRWSRLRIGKEIGRVFLTSSAFLVSQNT